MAANTESLSDKALSIFTFAAYHGLLSGERVSSVIRRDGKGHEADADGVAELEERGLARSEGDTIAFTDEGVAFLGTVMTGIRGAAGR
jgi:hypothetical protein